MTRIFMKKIVDTKKTSLIENQSYSPLCEFKCVFSPFIYLCQRRWWRTVVSKYTYVSNLKNPEISEKYDEKRARNSKRLLEMKRISKQTHLNHCKSAMSRDFIWNFVGYFHLIFVCVPVAQCHSYSDKALQTRRIHMFKFWLRVSFVSIVLYFYFVFFRFNTSCCSFHVFNLHFTITLSIDISYTKYKYVIHKWRELSTVIVKFVRVREGEKIRERIEQKQNNSIRLLLGFGKNEISTKKNKTRRTLVSRCICENIKQLFSSIASVDLSLNMVHIRAFSMNICSTNNSPPLFCYYFLYFPLFLFLSLSVFQFHSLL